MKYILKERLLSIGTDFFILNENKEKILYVDGKIITLSEKLHIKDISGKKIFTIKKKLLHLTDTYTIEKNGEVYATLKKDLINVLSDKFELEGPFGTIKIKGNFIDYDYKFKFNKKEIANVSKKFFSIKDTYAVEINNFEDYILILSCVVIIDMISHDSQEEKNNKKKKD